MDETKPNRVSHLFLVRLWLYEGAVEETDEAHSWQGKVQHVTTGRANNFNSQASMVQLLASMLALSNSAREERSEQSSATDPHASEPCGQSTETDIRE